MVKYNNGLIILLAVLFLSACEKEEEKPVDLNGSYIMINNDAYIITDALIENFGEIGTQGIYQIHLSIYSDIVATGKNGRVTTLSGVGNVLFLKIYSSTFDSLDNGNYVYNYSNNLGTFKDAKYKINWDTANKQTVWDLIPGGTISVSKNDDYYEIRFDGTDINGNTIKTVYKGILKYFY